VTRLIRQDRPHAKATWQANAMLVMTANPTFRILPELLQTARYRNSGGLPRDCESRALQLNFRPPTAAARPTSQVAKASASHASLLWASRKAPSFTCFLSRTTQAACWHGKRLVQAGLDLHRLTACKMEHDAIAARQRSSLDPKHEGSAETRWSSRPSSSYAYTYGLSKIHETLLLSGCSLPH
jgi:hypothetical protein